MTDTINDTPKTVFLAIDIAKQAHDVIISWPNGRKKMYKIANSLKGYQELLDLVGNDFSILAGFEPTADYHRNIAYWLQKQGV